MLKLNILYKEIKKELKKRLKAKKEKLKLEKE
jgi:hypothetical protein